MGPHAPWDPYPYASSLLVLLCSRHSGLAWTRPGFLFAWPISRSQYPVFKVRRRSRGAGNDYTPPRGPPGPSPGPCTGPPQSQGPAAKRGPPVPWGRGACACESAPRRSAAPCSPAGWTRSTIGARGLNFRVRDGSGCASPATAADHRGALPRAEPGRRALRAAQRDLRPVRPRPRAPAAPAGRGLGPISAARLRRSPALHLPPIHLVFCEGPL